MLLKPHTFFDGAALAAYCGLIFWLSAQEKLPVPPVFDFQDKLLHFAAYFVMGCLSWRAFHHLRLKNSRRVLLSMLFCILYGLSDEWHQSFVPGRESSLLDWLADSLGAAAALSVALLINRRLGQSAGKKLP